MVPSDGIALWAWDARPFPAFPGRSDVWSDAGNWRLGHWLNGRAGLALLQDVVSDLCGRAGASVDVSELDGLVPGYCLGGPTGARNALEPLMAVYACDAAERENEIVFRMRGAERFSLDNGRLVEEDGPALEITRAGLEGSEMRVRFKFVDAESDHAPGAVVSAGRADSELADVEAAVALDRGQALRCADMLAEDIGLRRESVRYAMAADGSLVEAGDVVVIAGEPWRVTGISDGKVIAFDAVRAGDMRQVLVSSAEVAAPPAPVGGVEPDVVIVDAPPLPGQEDDTRPLAFVFAEPWVGSVRILGGADPTQLSERGRVERPCAMGRLVSDLYPHVSGRWQEASLWVTCSVSLQSRAEAAVLNGANVALVETEAGWEMLQYLGAEFVDADTYKLTGLLRGQQGSETALAEGAAAGARIVFLTGAEQRLDLANWERGLELAWRAGIDPLDVAAWSGQQTFSGSGARPWSPAHLEVSWSDSDLTLGWVRRARKAGDAWLAGEPPHEWPEAYRVRVSGGVSGREWDVSGPMGVYSASDQAADFPAGGVAVIEVAQIGADGEPGGWTGLELTIPSP